MLSHKKHTIKAATHLLLLSGGYSVLPHVQRPTQQTSVQGKVRLRIKRGGHDFLFGAPD